MKRAAMTDNEFSNEYERDNLICNAIDKPSLHSLYTINTILNTEHNNYPLNGIVGSSNYNSLESNPAVTPATNIMTAKPVFLSASKNYNGDEDLNNQQTHFMNYFTSLYFDPSKDSNLVQGMYNTHIIEPVKGYLSFVQTLNIDNLFTSMSAKSITSLNNDFDNTWIKLFTNNTEYIFGTPMDSTSVTTENNVGNLTSREISKDYKPKCIHGIEVTSDLVQTGSKYQLKVSCITTSGINDCKISGYESGSMTINVYSNSVLPPTSPVNKLDETTFNNRIYDCKCGSANQDNIKRQLMRSNRYWRFKTAAGTFNDKLHAISKMNPDIRVKGIKTTFENGTDTLLPLNPVIKYADKYTIHCDSHTMKKTDYNHLSNMENTQGTSNDKAITTMDQKLNLMALNYSVWFGNILKDTIMKIFDKFKNKTISFLRLKFFSSRTVHYDIQFCDPVEGLITTSIDSMYPGSYTKTCKHVGSRLSTVEANMQSGNNYSSTDYFFDIQSTRPVTGFNTIIKPMDKNQCSYHSKKLYSDARDARDDSSDNIQRRYQTFDNNQSAYFNDIDCKDHAIYQINSNGSYFCGTKQLTDLNNYVSNNVTTKDTIADARNALNFQCPTGTVLSQLQLQKRGKDTRAVYTCGKYL